MGPQSIASSLPLMEQDALEPVVQVEDDLPAIVDKGLIGWGACRLERG